LGFTKSAGIQFIGLFQPSAFVHQTLDDVKEEKGLSEDEGQLMAEIPSEGLSSVTPYFHTDLLEHEVTVSTTDDLSLNLEESTISDTGDNATIDGNWRYGTSEGPSRLAYNSHNDFLEEEMTLDTAGDLSLNLEESTISDTNAGTSIHENLTQNESLAVDNISTASNIVITKAQSRSSEKFKYVCEECEEMFTKRGALSAHKRRYHTSAKVYECEFCMKQCTYRSQLDEHKRIHTKELPYMCEVCGKCFRTMTTLKSHEYVHKLPSYACQICNKKVRSRFYLSQHKRVHSIDKKLVCELCGKILYTAFSLQIHLRLHSGEKPFQCDICGKCFVAAVRLKRHRSLHTGKEFRCETCGKQFYYRHTLTQHQQCHNNLKHYKCQICLKEFTNSRNRYKHLKTSCNLPVCIVCNEIFPTDVILEEHRAREHTEEEIAVAAESYRKWNFKCCPVCSEVISGRGNMLKHIKESHKDYAYTPFSCEQCPKTYPTAHSLHKHRIWHSEQHSFSCATCGKTFKTKYTLKWHDVSVHQNRRPFQCNYCDHRSKRLSDLIVHKRKHTGERPFSCPICMRKFSTKHDLLKHAEKHSQSSENVSWKEVVDGTVPVNDTVFLHQT
jgi:DNA-directed RNA polymerase subunit RPC12/RpoP